MLVMVLGGCAGRDIDKLCPIAEAVQTDTQVAEGDKHQAFVARARQAVSTQPVKNVVEAVAMVSPSDRYAVLQKGASEVGKSGWTCASYEAIARH